MQYTAPPIRLSYWAVEAQSGEAGEIPWFGFVTAALFRISFWWVPGIIQEEIEAMAKYALYVPLKAKAGKEKDIEAFLAKGADLAKEEKGTVTWYGLKEGEGRYSVFDTFDNEAGQEAHLTGQIAKALKANWTTFFEGELKINKIEILAEKA